MLSEVRLGAHESQTGVPIVHKETGSVQSKQTKYLNNQSQLQQKEAVEDRENLMMMQANKSEVEEELFADDVARQDSLENTLHLEHSEGRPLVTMNTAEQLIDSGVGKQEFVTRNNKEGLPIQIKGQSLNVSKNKDLFASTQPKWRQYTKNPLVPLSPNDSQNLMRVKVEKLATREESKTSKAKSGRKYLKSPPSTRGNHDSQEKNSWTRSSPHLLVLEDQTTSHLVN